jgi:hypothetical protein
MTSQERAFVKFAEYAARLKGDEKSEARTSLFHCLEAFGHDAFRQAQPLSPLQP